MYNTHMASTSNQEEMNDEIIDIQEVIDEISNYDQEQAMQFMSEVLIYSDALHVALESVKDPEAHDVLTLMVISKLRATILGMHAWVKKHGNTESSAKQEDAANDDL